MKLLKPLLPILLTTLFCQCGGGSKEADPIEILEAASFPKPSGDGDLYPGAAEKVAGKTWGEVFDGASDTPPVFTKEELPDSPGHSGVKVSMSIAGDPGWALFRVALDGSGVTPLKIGEGDEVHSEDPADLIDGLASMYAVKKTPGALESLRAKSTATKNLMILQQFAKGAIVASIEAGGVYPDNLAGVRGHRQLKPGLVLTNPETGEEAQPIYFSGLDDTAGANLILFACPFTNPDGTRTVAFNDGSAKNIPETEYQTKLAEQRSE